MRTHVTFSNQHKQQLPKEFRADDVRYCEDLVEYFIGKYTAEADVVLDPFMGFGTTLVVAERMNRKGFGIEFDGDRCHYVRSLLQHPERAIHGDSTKIDQLQLPPVDFSMTSPPYMGRHHKENPFTAYTTHGDGYEQYLVDLRGIYEKLSHKMTAGANVVIEVSNLKHDDAPDAPITMLAWDIAREVSKVLRFEGEVVIAWEGGYAYGYDHSYALRFSKSE